MSKNRVGPDTDRFFKKKVHQNQNRNGAPFKRHQKSNRSEEPNSAGQKEKKFFDKKTYRMKKYSNKYKLDKWEENRRKSVLKKYYKDMKNDPQYGNYKPFDFDNVQQNSSDDDESQHEEDGPSGLRNDSKSKKNAEVENKLILESNSDMKRETEEEKIRYVMHPDAMEVFRKRQKSMNHPFRKAQQELGRLREAKAAKKAAAMQAKKERAEALAKYKQEKSEKFKKLSKKTRKGQPLMKDRMQMLLETIQKSTQR